MKTVFFVLFFFAVAGLAVAAEPAITPEPGCTCTGINKSTGKPWKATECLAACQSKRLVSQATGLDLLSNFHETPEKPADEIPKMDPELKKEQVRKWIIAGLAALALVCVAFLAFVAWKLRLPDNYKRRKKRYVSDQEKAAKEAVILPAAPLVANRAGPNPAPHHLAVMPPPSPPEPDLPEEVVDASGDKELLQRMVGRLESWTNPDIFPWATWGKKLSQFTMDRWGWQPEIKCFAGGMEISVQKENEHFCFLVLLNAVRLIHSPLRVVIIEENDSGSLFALMPEESVIFAVSQDGNVFVMNEGMRKLLRTPACAHEKAANL